MSFGENYITYLKRKSTGVDKQTVTSALGYEPVSPATVSTAVAEAVAEAPYVKKEVVSVLPTTNIDTNTIYMVKSNSGDEDNQYIEWTYVDGKWEKLGDTNKDETLSENEISDIYTNS